MQQSPCKSVVNRCFQRVANARQAQTVLEKRGGRAQRRQWVYALLAGQVVGRAVDRLIFHQSLDIRAQVDVSRAGRLAVLPLIHVHFLKQVADLVAGDQQQRRLCFVYSAQLREGYPGCRTAARGQISAAHVTKLLANR